MRRPSLLLAAALALGGCSLSINPDELDPLATVEGYCQTYSDLMIAIAGCSFTPELAALEYERSLPACDALGRAAVRYDGEAAKECIALLRSVTCDGAGLKQIQERAGGTCGVVLGGTLTDGAACLDAVECADPDAVCMDPELACGRTCTSPGVLDEPCGPNYPPCAQGHYCWTGEGKCKSASLDEGNPCAVAPVSCVAGLYCDACGEGAYCDAVRGCRRYGVEGDACGDRKCDLDEGLFCDGGTGKCRRRFSVAEGQPCDGVAQCTLDTYCTGGTCRPKSGLGASCTSEEECMPPLGCVGDSPAGDVAGACGPRRTPGESCTLDSGDCLVGAACVASAVGGVCVTWPDEYGAACSGRGDGGCLVGRCASDGTSPPVYTCQPYRARGEVCASDRECGGALLTDAGGRCLTSSADVPVCAEDCR